MGTRPWCLKMDFDNVGHLAGREGAEVSTVLVALDITDEVIDEAAAMGAELIVSHHPLIFSSVKSATDADLTGRKLVALLSRGMSAICMHTQFGCRPGRGERRAGVSAGGPGDGHTQQGRGNQPHGGAGGGSAILAVFAQREHCARRGGKCATPVRSGP